MRVNPVGRANEQVTVTVHQAEVFAGATVLFEGEWTHHPKFGEQFKAHEMHEEKPASASALEKYLGSGLISGVGVKHLMHPIFRLEPYCHDRTKD